MFYVGIDIAKRSHVGDHSFFLRFILERFQEAVDTASITLL